MATIPGYTILKKGMINLRLTDREFRALQSGQKLRRKPLPLEHLFQSAIFSRIREMERDYPEFAFIHANPNGGFRHPATARQMRAEGVRPGVFDISWDLKRGKYSGLRAECKADKNKMTADQTRFMEFYESQGFYCTLWRVESIEDIHGAVDKAIDAFLYYLLIKSK